MLLVLSSQTTSRYAVQTMVLITIDDDNITSVISLSIHVILTISITVRFNIYNLPD